MYFTFVLLEWRAGLARSSGDVGAESRVSTSCHDRSNRSLDPVDGPTEADLSCRADLQRDGTIGRLMTTPLRVLVAGCGNMGASHARAYHKMPEFEIVGLVSRGPASRGALSTELGGLPRVQRLLRGARRRRKPDVVSINTYPETHGALRAARRIEAGCHVFCEKPLAETVEEAQAIVDAARAQRAQAGGRLHPARPPRLDAVHRDRPHARQAAGHAHEPEPAEPRPGVGLAPQPDGLDEPDRRLRRPLRRRDVPDDRREAGARVGDRRAAHRRHQGRACTTTASCRSPSTTGRSAGTRRAGGR